MIDVEELEETWAILASIDPGTQGLRVREVPEAFKGSSAALFALDGDGARHALLPISEECEVKEDRVSSGVQIVAHRLLDEGTPRIFVDLHCRKPHLNAAFTQLVAEVISVWRTKALRADDACIEVVNKWRQLLDRAKPTAPDAATLQGVFGELWIVRELVRRNAGALRFWTGPHGLPHDFRCSGSSLEVKTITGNKWACQIHGLEQLAAPPDATLHLAVVKTEYSESGVSIAELAEDIIALGASRPHLASLLESYGIREESLSTIGARLSVVDSRFYEVNEQFPRLVTADLIRGQLASGVIKLSYTIDLSCADLRPLSDAEKEQLLEAMAQGDGR